MDNRVIFLMSVLILGLINNPFAFSNFDKIDPLDDSNFINSNLNGFAFAQNEVDDNGKEDEEEQAEGEQDEEEVEQIEIEVEIEDGIAKVEVKIDEDELEFELNTTNRAEIISEIIARTGLSQEEIENVIEFEIEENEEEIEIEDEEIEIEVEIENGVAKVKVKINDEETEFTIEEFEDRSDIIQRIIDETGLTEEQIINVIKFEGEEAEEEEETEIEVEVEKGKAKIKIELDGEKSRFVLDTTDESEILSFIAQETGLDESQIRSIWDFEIEDEEEESDEEERVKELSKLSEHQDEAKENAEQIILELQQKIEELEQRLQVLLEKFETGEYFGPVPEPDPVPTSYSISFVGSATSLDDGSIVAGVDGEIFLETLMNDASKLRITGGEILIGDTFYDFVIGKARSSSTGPSGEKDSMIILGQVMDDEGNVNTIKIILDAETPFTGDFGSEPVQFEIMPQSKIAKQWNLSASGQLSLLEV